MNIFMDDQRPAPYGFILAESIEEALHLVRTNAVQILSLDYNMGFRKQTGLDFVEVFCKEGLYANEIILHTNDIIGRKRMEERFLQGKEKGEINSLIKVVIQSY
ncbi:cyclic-phosphate processing receiver domain-containing protein [Ectobacillus sp. sgz5001026]|uniref:cyclic-phosphate processing receiver domain-containing protein n=1 Tax=Ectobacillus sp. sgz5001026 TaxID=3242473 RepID=UPI0036D3A4B3